MMGAMERYQEVAVSFAAALVERNFARARELLAPALREDLSEERLEEELAGMYREYAKSEPSRIRFVPEDALETWPGQQPGDLGWVYVGIEGDDFLEAVTVLVSDVDRVPMIKEIEWGRP